MILTCAAIIGWSHKGQASSKVVWEYKVARPLDKSPEAFMNELGAEGWELVEVLTGEQIDAYRGYFVFKRAK